MNCHCVDAKERILCVKTIEFGVFVGRLYFMFHFVFDAMHSNRMIRELHDNMSSIDRNEQGDDQSMANI